jgi:hypothetical protein
MNKLRGCVVVIATVRCLSQNLLAKRVQNYNLHMHSYAYKTFPLTLRGGGGGGEVKQAKNAG